MEKTDSATRGAEMSLQGVGWRPERTHSEVPYGLFMDVLFAASRMCSEMMFMLHSFVSKIFLSVSLARS